MLNASFLHLEICGSAANSLVRAPNLIEGGPLLEEIVAAHLAPGKPLTQATGLRGAARTGYAAKARVFQTARADKSRAVAVRKGLAQASHHNARAIAKEKDVKERCTPQPHRRDALEKSRPRAASRSPSGASSILEVPSRAGSSSSGERVGQTGRSSSAPAGGDAHRGDEIAARGDHRRLRQLHQGRQAHGELRRRRRHRVAPQVAQVTQG